MEHFLKACVGSLAAWLLVAVTGPALAGELEFDFDAADFTPGAAIDNPYWPLIAGTRFVYYAESEDGCAVNQMTVTGDTKSDFAAPYDSIVAWVVEDREWLDEECAGEYALMEETYDWFAQDVRGNIWYFGEATTAWDHDDECPSHSGAWQAGADGAEPGVVMPANPVLGAWYRQEFFEGEAEDRARVLRTNAEVSIGLGTYAGCLRTKEYTPLAPGEIEHKNYCPAGGGLLLINELKGRTVRVEFIGSALPAGTYAAAGVCEE